ncbi:MAG TPA: type II toxin-antitoxin system death-on-curing family toxin [Candidatus Paceibacterota bacterium]
MIRYISAETILVLHSEVIDATGGSHGVREVGLLAAIAGKPRTTFGGVDLYPDIFTKAAVYLEPIVNYHVFIDGNKRTGITVCARFLFLNGYELTATNPSVETFVLSVATDKLDHTAIALWLKKHTRKGRKDS